MKRFLLACGHWVLWAMTASAAELATPVPGQPGLHPILFKVFGDLPAFTATAQVRFTGVDAKDTMQMPMRFSYLAGRMRAEINMAEVRSEQLPAQLATTLKQIGMDRVVTIMRSGSRPAWVLYPGLKASVEIATPQSKPGEKTARVQESIEELKVGMDDVGGRRCDKFLFIHRDEQGRTQEAFVWRDPAFQQFPVRIRMPQAESTLEVSYQDIKLAKPSEESFMLPPGYTSYDSVESVMKEATKRLLAKPE